MIDAKAPATVHYDITELLEYARHNATLSGIQRVSIQIISRMVSKNGSDRLRLIGWHPVKKRIVSFDASYFSGGYKYDQDEFCWHFGLRPTTTSGVGLNSYLARKYGRSWKRPVHHARLVLMNGLTAGRTFERRNISLIQPKHPPVRMGDGLALAPGDLVFAVGATWNFEEYLSALAEERRRRGIAICHFIHDLIPILTPEHVGDEVPERFGWWLKNLSANSDYFLTNSQATKRDVDAWLDENGFNIPTSVLPLAHQFADISRHISLEDAPSGERVHARVRNAARLPYVLCVGTIESRKNIWTLANVWKDIHAQLGGATPRLIFAGKQGGGLNDDFEDFIRGTGSLYGFIRVLERPNDAELAFLYRKCLFSVFPSYKEGWGLPVGESLWLGRPVVCSNTSSMPEVAGALADYIDPTSWKSMEGALMRMITDTDYREKRAAEIAKAPLRTWSDVADDLWHELASGVERQWPAHLRSPRAGAMRLQAAD